MKRLSELWTETLAGGGGGKGSKRSPDWIGIRDSPCVVLVRELNSENCLHLIFASPPCEKVIIVPDTNYITSAIRKFLLDMPSPGSLKK